ncbi:uncharacterized protein BDV14DRAFT_201275 [Aspergillus stella-maris]|uniref:uncharacterized protein n=1 Tax=Aspergillus stella-maris TaxID=1810926 RepID=UPI003CCCDAE6
MALSSYPNEPIAIVGTACRFSGDSNTPSALWSLLKYPRDVSSEIPKDRFNIDGHYTPTVKQGKITTKHTYFLSDIKSFDAGFFQIPPAEAESVDPQQRLLLETIYESLENAGLTISGLRGSDTSVYIGLMSVDYLDIIQADVDILPKYTGSGISRSIDANRISYFFDWNGPSIAIDTACSSSMTALHLAVQGLRSGESSVAVVAGANLIITPQNFVTLSNLKMISPDGKSKMWDASANGYARGEGVASVILKTLSQAIEDGDTIDCIIRETGVNQDGRTTGLTMPSSKAQADLIRKTYQRAGLDISKRVDRPQFFEAHGTGTKVGDVREAEAVHGAFFSGREERLDEDDAIAIGSIKTVIGHTEGTAGLAGVLKAMLAIKSGFIPPNMHFKEMNPKIVPFAQWLRLATALSPWPDLPEGVPRRASVNSFGFGGSNGHAILESYDNPRALCAISNANNDILPTPFLFSAQSERSLISTLRGISKYLRSTNEINLRGTAWTLQQKRSTLSVRTAITARTKKELLLQLHGKLLGSDKTPVGIKTSNTDEPRILGIFTGQGAQWAGMAQDLLRASSKARGMIQSLDESLGGLPREQDRPSWTIEEELMNPAETSRLKEAAISQPLHTAVQILLVDMLHSAGVRFYAVIGHSSGEIGAAYAAGFISASDAIRLAYYRGLSADLAQDENGKRGAMMAAGISSTEGHELCDLPRFQGRICVAASNSSSSITISGDHDAIHEAKLEVEQGGNLARLLEVDTAYHSHHMHLCTEPYLDALKSCDIQPSSRDGDRDVPYWLSSVYPGQALSGDRPDLSSEYWVANMTQPVQFAAALHTALSGSGDKFKAALEIGPHPALQSPVLQTIEEAHLDIPYSGILSRGKNDVAMFSEALGMLWAHCKPGTVDFTSYDQTFFNPIIPAFVRDLPSYPWDHSQSYWFESRVERARRTRKGPVHPLLGVPYGDETETEVKWRSFLIPKEISWLSEHRVQGRAVLPGAAYAVMGMEAALLKVESKQVRLVELNEMAIHRGISFEDEIAGVEVVTTLSNIQRARTRELSGSHEQSVGERLVANWTVHSPSAKGSDSLSLVCSGSIRITLGTPKHDILPGRLDEDAVTNMVPVDVDDFYTALERVGYGFTGSFRSISCLQRKVGHSSGSFDPPAPPDASTIHPALLDVAFHGIMAAISYPGDDGLRDLKVPTGIGAIRFNPYHSQNYQSGPLSFDTSLDKTSGAGDTTFYNNGGDAIIQIEGVVTVPLAKPTEADDRNIFSEEMWADVEPDSTSIMAMLGREVDVKERNPGFVQAVAQAARLIKQISHRYPHMNILGIGTGTADATKIILSHLGSGFHSYTCANTDATVALPTPSRQMYNTADNKVIVKPFDSRTDLLSQGFKGHSYDLVVSTTGFNTADDVKAVLSGVHSLIRPGGYLVLVKQLNQVPGHGAKASSNISTSKLQLSSAQWHTLLSRSGFSGIDTIAKVPHDETTNPFSVLLSQAVDDHINWLRQPLFASIPAGLSMDAMLGDLLIIGGTSLETSRLCTGVQIMLTHRFHNIMTADTLEDLNTVVENEELPGTVLVLTELEEPIFKNLTSDKLQAMKALFTDQRCVLWVTHSHGTDPYTSMTIALGRVASNEQKDLQLQFLDVEGVANFGVLDSRRLSEMLLRLRAASIWELECTLDSMLWTTEPELRLTRNSRLLVPRIYQKEAQNNRYNSKMRQICYDVSPATDKLTIIYSESSNTFDLRKGSLSHTNRPTDDSVSIRVFASLLSALKLADGRFLFLALGKRVDTDSTVLALSSCNSSLIDVPCDHFFPVSLDTAPADARSLLLGSTWGILAHTILAKVQPGEVLLTLGVEQELLQMLSHHAANQRKSVRAVSVPGDAGITNSAGVQTIFVHPHELQSVMKAKIPPNVSAFLDLSRADHELAQGSLQSRLVSALPDSCLVHTADTLFSKTSICPTASQRSEHPFIPLSLRELLTDISSKTDEREISSPMDSLTRPLSCVSQLRSNDGNPFTIINWTAENTIAVDYESIDNDISFRTDATYLLVGLTGDLGQSLCEWFVDHGARYIALASRDPSKIDERWLRAMTKSGATVKLCTMDVTDKASIQAACTKLQLTTPPIAGVANAAMILRDKLLSNMELDDFLTVMKPKVDGSQHLHDIFGHNHPLDFFILFSSLSTVLGNVGQSNYAVANAFMASLIAQRRAEGLSGSVMHIGPIFGAGYATRSGQFRSQDLAASGLYPLSITDFHQLFGEAVLASPPGSGRKPEITAGLRTITSKADSRVLWRSNPRFAHFCKIDDEESGSAVDTKTSLVLVKAHLASAMTTEQAREVIQHCFSAQLADILRLTAETMDHKVPLVQLGVDSHVAVEVRSWFRKQLDVRTSLLRVLSGASVDDLVSDALELINPEFIPNVRSEEELGEPVSVATDLASEGDSIELLSSASSLPSMESLDDTLSSHEGYHNLLVPGSKLDQSIPARRMEKN